MLPLPTCWWCVRTRKFGNGLHTLLPDSSSMHVLNCFAGFAQEKYINDREVLVAAAESVGIPGARDYLADPNNGRAEVLKELSSAPRGMSGVPHFVIGDQIHLGGAQPPAQFVAAFNQLLGGRA